MEALIGDYVDVQTAAQIESSLPPGLYEARFYIPNPVTSGDISRTVAYLKDEGVDVRSVSQKKAGGLWYLSVKYVKHAPTESISFLPLAVIPLIGFALVSALVGVGIFKLETITNNIAKVLLIAGGVTIVLVAMLKKPLEKVVEKKF